MHPLIITLDGPAGSGKSTVARRLAGQLGVTFLDTGAMYRGVCAACLDAGINPATQSDAVIRLARQCRLWFDWSADPPRLNIDAGEASWDISDRLRDHDVTASVSDVASMPEVRRELVKMQRQIGAERLRLVTDGRDQGSVVFPDAQIKFFLDADLSARARRRAHETRQAGRAADDQVILDDLRHRDRRDRTRADGPLICPDDAIRIDTTDLSIDQVVQRLAGLIKERVPGAAKGGP